MFSTRNVAAAQAVSNLSIDPRKFSYAVITETRGSRSLKVGDVYPILHELPANTEYSQAVRGDRSTVLSFEYPTVLLAGVKTPRGNATKPYAWDARRVKKVTFDQLTRAQQETAIARFGTVKH